MKKIVVLSMFVVVLNQSVFSQAVKYDSILKIAEERMDKKIEQKANEIEMKRRLDESMKTFEEGKKAIKEMKQIMCLRFRSYRKYRRCMCENY